MSIQPLISLIVAVYNKPHFLELILESLLRQSFASFEIIIADDGSTPEIENVISNYSHKFSIPIQHVWHDDRGFRKTVILNKAACSSQTDYLVFIDGDCILHKNFLEAHFKHRKPGSVLSGRRVNFSEKLAKNISVQDIQSGKFEKRIFWWNDCPRADRRHGFFIPFSFEIENFFKKKYWAIGCNFSIHKDDFLSVNGYDEQIIGRGLEDINLSSRFTLKGIPTLTITREALQYHLQHSSDPVPHDGINAHKFMNPTNFWATKGILKNPE